ncbi:MAG: tyrosine-type recombinase/integrase [Saprospiraceae bacterium]
MHEYKPQYWLFEGQDQKNQYSDRSVQEVVRKAAKKAGITIKVTPHSLRHSYATHLVDVGTQLPYVKELFGHKDIHPVGFSKYNRNLFRKYIFPLPDFKYFSRLVASC